MFSGHRHLAVRLAKEEEIQTLNDDRIGNAAHDRRRALTQDAMFMSRPAVVAALIEPHWLTWFRVRYGFYSFVHGPCRLWSGWCSL